MGEGATKPSIPRQLETWRFILLTPGQKIPIAEMKGWAEDREHKTYAFNDPQLLQHNGNYGVCTDKDRFVLAADTKEIEKAIEERLPRTLTVRSPRHQTKHFYFYGSLSGPIQCKPTSEGDPCADVKFGNAYVLGPGSTFSGYGNYEVVDDLPIASITEDQMIAAINEFIVSKKLTIEPTETQINNPELNFPIINLLPNLNGMTHNGNELFGPHPKHGSTTGSNFHINKAKNVWHCFRNGHESGGGPLELLAIMEGIIECEEAKKGALRGDKFFQVLNKAVEKGYLKELPKNLEPRQFTKVIVDKNGHVRIEPDIEQILKYFDEKYIFKTSTDTEDIYFYDDGVYKIADINLKREIESLLGPLTRTHFVNETLDHIRRKSYTERTEFNKLDIYLPCKNGLLNLDSLELEPFNPNKIFTFKLPVKYDSSKMCPVFQNFLTQVLDKENIQCVQEQCGYMLLPKMSYHKIFLWYGSGRNGKGVLSRTMTTLLGADNVSNLTLEQLSGNNRFAIAGLYGKLANFSSEPIVNQNILNTSTLKRITGQNTIDAEIKNKQNFLRFVNMAKPVIEANRYPRVEDNTLAFWDRIVMTPFEKTFLEGINQTPDLEKAWTTDENEMSGILNWMLEGLRRLRKNNSFTISKSQTEKKIEYQRQANPISAFIMEKLERDTEATIERLTVYEQYKLYAEDLGVNIESDRIFYNKIRELPFVSETQVRKEKTQIRIFKGFKLKTEPTPRPIWVEGLPAETKPTSTPEPKVSHLSQMSQQFLTPKKSSINTPQKVSSEIRVTSVTSVTVEDPERHCENCGVLIPEATNYFKTENGWLCSTCYQAMNRAGVDLPKQPFNPNLCNTSGNPLSNMERETSP